jgi:hypothetical protein
LPAESIAKADGAMFATAKDALFALAGIARICAVSAINKLPAASIAMAEGFTAVEVTGVEIPLCKLKR